MDYVASRRQLIERNGFALSKTFGTSMRPLIWGGQHCVAVAPLEGEPALGDLLLFESRAGLERRNIVHRLIEIRGEGAGRVYVTRGDNCLDCEQVRREEIIGHVAEVHRIGGFRPWHAIPARRFAVTDPACRRYSRLWMALWPARRQYYRLRARVYGAYARLKQIFKRKK
ncbi:MAG: hypothetical protein K2N10_08980 [Muribaculaceae bacterium]|nr:hypothetical protein [Muribaculaceae bacterium]